MMRRGYMRIQRGYIHPGKRLHDNEKKSARERELRAHSFFWSSDSSALEEATFALREARKRLLSH